VDVRHRRAQILKQIDGLKRGSIGPADQLSRAYAIEGLTLQLRAVTLEKEQLLERLGRADEIDQQPVRLVKAKPATARSDDMHFRTVAEYNRRMLGA
jgi:hypothetical protein